jgi:peroxiredoxin
LRDHYATIQALDAEVIALAAEPAAAARDAVHMARLPYPILSDETLTVIDRYGLRHIDEPEGREIARPSLFVLDRAGTVRYAHVGEHVRDRPALGAVLLALESID